MPMKWSEKYGEYRSYSFLTGKLRGEGGVKSEKGLWKEGLPIKQKVGTVTTGFKWEHWNKEMAARERAGKPRPITTQAGDVTSLLKRKKKRGRGATIMGPGRTGSPGLLSLLQTRRTSLFGE